jgi:hypothetical protein
MTSIIAPTDSLPASSDHPLVKWYLLFAGPQRALVHHQESQTLAGTDGTTPAPGIPVTAPASIRVSRLAGPAAWLKGSPFGYLQGLTITFVPGTSILGHTLSLHWGWSDSSVNDPATRAEFHALAGYGMRTYGGLDNSSPPITLTAPFNEARLPICKARNLPLGGEVTFWYYFTIAKYGSVQATGDLFEVLISADLVLHGVN